MATAETRCAALLFRLDRVGLLARGLSSGGRRLVSCVPLRPPPEAPAANAHPRGRSDFRRVRSHAPTAACVSLEAPGSWASMTIHDRDLLPLLHDLAVGRPAAELAAAAVGHSEEAILAVLALMSWCGLLDGAERRRVVGP